MGKLTNYEIQRNLDSLSIEACALIPHAILMQIRAHHMNTPKEVVYQALDSIGIVVICDLVSQGVLPVDVAQSLDIPYVYLDKWLKSTEERIEFIAAAYKGSAQTHLSDAMKMYNDVGSTDVDAARVAKIKADHNTFLAKHHDPDMYGDKSRNKEDGGDSPVVWNINIGGNAVDHTQKRVIDI